MGVHGLWELLAPVGRRVSVETLSGKKLAIDASIWMVQFMKAMRDEKGEMVRNGHILGFFRRICKLLFLRTKPVFVFDGGTPALKRRTVIARRRQRENAQAKIRKTAEKLLLNHLKAMRLKEIVKDIENQRQKNDKKGKNVVFEGAEVRENSSERIAKATVEYDRETLDAKLAASLAAEESASLTGNAPEFVDGSIAGEEEEEEDGDEEEMVLPVMHGKIDPAVLAALPPSMQLDLLVQMRERLMAENRQKYQKVKKVPARFSELQIQSYLKTVAFRREIDEVQKSAAGKGVGGVQTSRIASEANREFIFSSSFSGDKQTLMSAGIDKSAEVEKNGDNEDHAQEKGHASTDSVNRVSSSAQPGSMTGSGMDEPSPSSNCLGNDVETYVDERGRLRVSRVRAMGIHMTRDLQRNLDFLKEIERDKLKEANSTETDDILDKIAFCGTNNSSVNNHLPKAASGKENNESRSLNVGIDELVQGESSQVLEKKAAFEISFFEDEKEHCGAYDDDNDLFAQLVAGSSVNMSSMMNLSGKHSDCTSDCSWEEGFVEENGSSVNNDVAKEGQISFADENVNDDDLDWEYGAPSVPDIASLTPSIQTKGISKGSLEEEADIQEAIRRSMEDFTQEISTATLNKKESIEIPTDTDNYNKVAEVSTPDKDNIDLQVVNDLVLDQPSCGALSGLGKPGHRDDSENLWVNDSIENPLASSMEPSVKHYKEDLPLHESSNVAILTEKDREYRNMLMEIPCADAVDSNGQKGVHLTVDQHVDTLKDGGNGVTSSARDSSHVSATVLGENEISEVSNVNAHGHDVAAAPTCHSYEGMDQSGRQEEIEAQIMASEASLDEEMLLLREECANLGDEQRKLERNADSVSSEMFAECQELLQMFGLPYIIAPMEAEAQCAYMELANLVDGVVTDDSDVFLFGARSVYKNIFDNRKYVETYFMKDIESELGLSREKLIRMALLLGSDYTEGVSGIGIVNAIEVVNAFPEEGGLQNFREWLESPDPSILGKLDGQSGSLSRKRGSKAAYSEMDSSNHNMEVGSSSNGSVVEGHNDMHLSNYTDNIRQIFMDKHRNVSKNWHIPSSFPSEAVISAYVSPQVDKSTEPFFWGKPDLAVLRKLCWEKFGWSNHKADELLLPVLKEYNKHETQLRLEAFYTFNERFAKIRSKRIKKAVKGMAGNQSSEVVDDQLQEGSKSRKRRVVNLSEPGENKSENLGTEGSECKILEKASLRQSRKRKTVNITLPSEERNSETLLPEENGQNTRTLRTERGRGRGRGRGKIVGAKKVVNRHEPSSSSHSDGSDYHIEREDMPVKTEISSQVRRSTRLHKQIKYATTGTESGSMSDSSDKNEPKCTEEVLEQEAVIDGRCSGATGEDIRKTDRNTMQNDDTLSNFLETGGGFCLDEAELESKPANSASCPAGASDKDNIDYLKMGGGFCVDEDEPATEPAASSSGLQRDSCVHLDGGKMDVPGATRNPGSPDNVHKYDTRNVGLTPMPFLRRKRRKSQNK